MGLWWPVITSLCALPLESQQPGSSYLQWGDSFQGGERLGLVGYLTQLCLGYLPVSMSQSPKAGEIPLFL